MIDIYELLDTKTYKRSYILWDETFQARSMVKSALREFNSYQANELYHDPNLLETLQENSIQCTKLGSIRSLHEQLFEDYPEYFL